MKNQTSMATGKLFLMLACIAALTASPSAALAAPIAEKPPSAVMIQTSAKGFALITVMVLREFDAVRFQYANMSDGESPTKVKLTVTDLETHEVLGELLVGVDHSSGHPWYTCELPQRLRQGRPLMLQVRPDSLE